MFEQIVNEKINELGCYELQGDPEFRDYITKVHLMMTSIDENLIGFAIINYLYFHKQNKGT